MKARSSLLGKDTRCGDYGNAARMVTNLFPRGVASHCCLSRGGHSSSLGHVPACSVAGWLVCSTVQYFAPRPPGNQPVDMVDGMRGRKQPDEGGERGRWWRESKLGGGLLAEGLEPAKGLELATRSRPGGLETVLGSTSTLVVSDAYVTRAHLYEYS